MTSHTPRDTFGCLYAQRTGDMLGLQNILGYSSIATTEKVHAYFKPDLVAGKTASLEGLGSGRISARSTHEPVRGAVAALRLWKCAKVEIRRASLNWLRQRT
jgi:hypothetical protein